MDPSICLFVAVFLLHGHSPPASVHRRFAEGSSLLDFEVNHFFAEAPDLRHPEGLSTLRNGRTQVHLSLAERIGSNRTHSRQRREDGWKWKRNEADCKFLAGETTRRCVTIMGWHQMQL
ncbi:hypothetical protein BIW11_04963 [Tropilaelaps mercedesae]|uniref:Uncharacterized protein n=1 Tax=Tropilaelaps mercedesae TaxID=418985 RepID=A0A1V9WZJ9_9ACAR|nr:hypothetical protein BIW11_04963 [Tropilaelaps mercedesae]